MQFSGSGSKDSLSSLYVLKHKDLDVAMVQIDNMTGSIEVYFRYLYPGGTASGLRCQWRRSERMVESQGDP